MGGSKAPMWGRTAGIPAGALERAVHRALRIGSPVHVLAHERMGQASVRVRLAGEQLEEVEPAAIEGVRRACEIDAPDPELLFPDFRARGFGVLFQPIDPLP